MKVSEHQYDVESKVTVFRISPTARNMNFCIFYRGSINANVLYITSGCLASSATPLTFSMEDSHI